MRYRPGTIQLNERRDYPLLRRVLHCGFVTSDQLYAFMRLEYCATSRSEFANRLRRLLTHEMLVRHQLPTISRGIVYAIAPAGASELVGRGECYSGSVDKLEASSGHVQHALELNDVHLALRRSGSLVRWVGESNIRSRNEMSDSAYAKDYDAIVDVRIAEQEYRFAVEYERTPKSRERYEAICKTLNYESELRHILYLVSNYDLLRFLLREFSGCQRRVHFCLRNEFLINTLRVPVQSNCSPVSMSFQSVLTTGALNPRAPDKRDPRQRPF